MNLPIGVEPLPIAERPKGDRAYPVNFANHDFRALRPGEGWGLRADGHIRSLADNGYAAALGMRLSQLGRMAFIAGQAENMDYGEDHVQLMEADRRQAIQWLAGGRLVLGIYQNLEGRALRDVDLAHLTEAEVRLRAYVFAAPRRHLLLPGSGAQLALRMDREAREIKGLDESAIELMEAALVRAGVRRSALWVHIWETDPNVPAFERRLYQQARGVAPLPANRPTIHFPGEVVHGHQVTYHPELEVPVVPDRELLLVRDPALESI